jgi:hypothetical protein
MSVHDTRWRLTEAGERRHAQLTAIADNIDGTGSPEEQLLLLLSFFMGFDKRLSLADLLDTCDEQIEVCMGLGPLDELTGIVEYYTLVCANLAKLVAESERDGWLEKDRVNAQ